MYTQTINPRLDHVNEVSCRRTLGIDHHLSLGLFSAQDIQSRPKIDNALELDAKVESDEMVNRIQRLMSEGNYREAVSFGRWVQKNRTGSFEATLGYWWLPRAEFELCYALALIYTGAAAEGIALLKAIIAEWEAGQRPEDVAKQGNPRSFRGLRRNYVLGRAHNNLGYADWKEQRHPDLALREFRLALFYFRASDLREEYANTCNNMGRVYAELGQREQAQQRIKISLKLRQQLGVEYRTALSLNSLGYFHLEFDEPEPAYRWASIALEICLRLGRERGIGLASLTLGRACRKMANQTNQYSQQERATFFKEAKEYLLQAMMIFEERVQEPVRATEAHYELGCLYQDQAALTFSTDGDLARAAEFEHLAKEHLEAAIESARDRHLVWYQRACSALSNRQEHWSCNLLEQVVDICSVEHQPLPAIALDFGLEPSGSAEVLSQVRIIGGVA